MTRSGPSKQVKRYVNANKKDLDDLKSQVGAVASEIGALRAKVEGDGATCHGPTVAPTIVSSGTATAEPVYVRSGWTRTVEMTPQGVAILHEEQHVNDDMLLDPTTLATSPTPISVPVIGRFAMIRNLLVGVGYVTGAVFVASGVLAWSTLIGLKTGTVELTTVIEAGSVINEHLGWVLGGTFAANVGNVARQVLPWVIATRRASAARLSTLEEQLARLSEQLAK